MFYNALKAVQATNFRDKERRIEDLGNYFIAKVTNMFKYDGLPPTIPVRALEMILQQYGYVVITEVKGELYPLYGGLGGAPNPYYMPTIATVANPALDFSAMLEIGKECIVFPNDSAYMGLGAIISKYATLLAENELSFYTGIVHSRLFPILIAEDNNAAQSCKLYLKELEEGTFGVIRSNPFMESVKVNPLNSFSPRAFTEMIELQEYLKGAFYEEIGLDYQTNLKRENISETELDVGQYPMQTLVQDMLAQRKIGVELINNMYGTDISVEFSRTWENQEQDVFDVKHIIGSEEGNDMPEEKLNDMPEQEEDSSQEPEQEEPTADEAPEQEEDSSQEPEQEQDDNPEQEEPTADEVPEQEEDSSQEPEQEESTADEAPEQEEDDNPEQEEDSGQEQEEPTADEAPEQEEDDNPEQEEDSSQEQEEPTVDSIPYDENQITALDIGVDEFIEDTIIDDVIEVADNDTK